MRTGAARVLEHGGGGAGEEAELLETDGSRLQVRQQRKRRVLGVRADRLELPQVRHVEPRERGRHGQLDRVDEDLEAGLGAERAEALNTDTAV